MSLNNPWFLAEGYCYLLSHCDYIWLIFVFQVKHPCLWCSIIGRLFVACPPSADICLSVCFTLDCVQFSKTDCASVRFNVDNGNKTSPWFAHKAGLSFAKIPNCGGQQRSLFSLSWTQSIAKETNKLVSAAPRLSDGVNWRIGKDRTADRTIFHTNQFRFIPKTV